MALMKKLTAALAASSLVLGLVGTAAAGFSPAEGGLSAGTRLMDLKVISGKPGTTVEEKLALSDKITRAEFVTIMVGAYNQKATAAAAKGIAAYPDSASSWASGEIFAAKNLIEAKGASMGKPGGLFDPTGEVSAAEAVAFLMKFLGIKEDTTKAWPASAIDAAVAAGLISADDKATITPVAGAAANRGLVFYLMDQAFYNYELETGKTIYTTYADTSAPTTTVTSKLSDNTIDAAYEVTGVAGDAVSIEVGGELATINEDGTFTATAALEVGDNDIAIVARDLAGNAKIFTAKITRSTGDAASIAAEDIEVVAGASIELGADVLDANENVIADAAISGTSTLGKVEGGKFIAGEKAGTGTLTLTSGAATTTVNVTVVAGDLAKVVADKTSVAKGDKAVLSAADAFGNVITGATFTMDSVDANVGTSNGVFIGSKPGSYTVTASKDGKSAQIVIGVFDAADRLVISAPSTLVGNYSTDGSYVTVTVAYADANGNIVTNQATGNITLSGAGLTIKGKVSGNATEATTNGVATFKVYAPSYLGGANISLSATDASGTPITSKTSPTIAIQAQQAKKVTIEADDQYLATNTAGNVGFTVEVVDQAGFPMRNGSYPVKLALSGVGSLSNSSAVTSETVTTTAGIYNTGKVYVGQGITGNATVTATVDGLETASASASVSAVIAGSASKIAITAEDAQVVAGSTGTEKMAKFTVKVTDANNVPIVGSHTLSIDLSGLDSTSGLALYAADGTTPITITSKKAPLGTTASSEVTFYLSTISKFTGNVPVKITGTGLSSATASTTVVAGAYTELGMVRDAVYVPVANPAATVSAQLYDAMGNAVKVAGVEITAVAKKATAETDEVTLNGTAKTVKATTNADGVAIFEVATRPYSGQAYTINVSGFEAGSTTNALEGIGNNAAKLIATVNVDTVSTQSVAVELLKQAKDALGNPILEGGNPVWVTAGYVNAGDTVKIRATVKDNYGGMRIANTALSAVVEKIFAHTDGKLYNDTTTLAALNIVDGTTTGDGIYESGNLTIGKAGLVSVTVKDTAGPTEVSGSAQMLVYAGAVEKAIVTGAEASATYDGKIKPAKNTVAGPFTLQLVDAYGNAVTTTGDTAVTISHADATKAAVRTAADGLTVGSLNTRGTVTFYVSVVDDTTITFQVGAKTYVLEVDAQ